MNGGDTIYYVSDTTGSLSYTLAEIDKNGNVIATYNHADVLISQVRGDVTSYYFFDGHGDVRALNNIEGRITDTYRYNAYGELIERSGETENHYLYTGEYYDGTSNLYYLRARYMNPSTGTFISMDTYEGSIYDPDTLHKYLYANGNPVKYSDPSGNNYSLANMAIAAGGMMLLASVPLIMFNLHKTIADAGIIPNSSYSLISNMQESLIISGICNVLSITLAIKEAIEGKVRGQVEIYEASEVDAVDAADQSNKKKDVYYVYFLADDTEEIQYVGRTKNLKSRLQAHKNSANRSELELVGFVRVTNYAACRAIEQAGMLAAHTLKAGKDYNNQRNGVRLNNSDAGDYLEAANQLLKAENMSDYILNQIDNERLNQIEQYVVDGLAEYESIY